MNNIPNLIEELKRDHSLIIVMLNRAKDMGIYSKDIRSTILSIREDLLQHLSREDISLYPVLRKAAENDKDLQGTIDFFVKDMEIVAKTALEFFEKYLRGAPNIELAIDFGRLLGYLQIRIMREENVLYPAYEKINPRI